MTEPVPFGRRRFLQRAGTFAVAGAGGFLLAGCGDDSDTASPSAPPETLGTAAKVARPARAWHDRRGAERRGPEPSLRSNDRARRRVVRGGGRAGRRHCRRSTTLSPDI